MVTSFIKHLKIYFKLVKFAASLEMEYRVGFFLGIVVDMLYFVATLFGVRVLYWNVTDIAGWSYYELLVLVGINMAFMELILGLTFIGNLRQLPDKIASGDLDLVLTKPLNSQFAVSLWRPAFVMVFGMFVGFLTSWYGFTKTGLSFNGWNVLPFIIMFISGEIMAYSLAMMILTLSIWIIRGYPLPMLAQNLISMSKNPFSVFEGVWRVIFLTVLPIGFMTSLPASTLMGKGRWWWLPLSVFIAAIFLKGSNLFWNFALKRYSSASS